MPDKTTHRVVQDAAALLLAVLEDRADDENTPHPPPLTFCPSPCQGTRPRLLPRIESAFNSWRCEVYRYVRDRRCNERQHDCNRFKSRFSRSLQTTKLRNGLRSLFTQLLRTRRFILTRQRHSTQHYEFRLGRKRSRKPLALVFSVQYGPSLRSQIQTTGIGGEQHATSHNRYGKRHSSVVSFTKLR